MPSDVVKHGRITHGEFDDDARPFALDLTAAFNLMQEDVLKLLDKAVKEKWTPDVLMNKIGEII